MELVGSSWVYDLSASMTINLSKYVTNVGGSYVELRFFLSNQSKFDLFYGQIGIQ